MRKMPEHTMIPHERDRLNDEIERAFIETTAAAIRIMMYRQTERGTTANQLFDDIFQWFSYLVVLTADLSQVSRHGDEHIQKAHKWMELPKTTDHEDKIMQRCHEGVKVFLEYKKMLGEQGVISLPSG